MKMKFWALSLVLSCAAFSLQAEASDKTDSVKVLGNCESCQSRIEKAAKIAGASVASWNSETQMLTVSYDDAKTSLLSIEKHIAGVGHDTRDVKATNEAYTKLHSCCQYDRTGLAGAKACTDEKEKQ